MTDKELFKVLDPDNCWHEREIGYDRQSIHLCSNCYKYFYPEKSYPEGNPDFTTWEGFGVMITEGQKRDWWEKFYLWAWKKSYPLSSIKVADCLPGTCISPTRLRDALKGFLKEMS